MYGGLGEMGKPLEEFNRLFNKLLNTEFVEKKEESKGEQSTRNSYNNVPNAFQAWLIP